MYAEHVCKYTLLQGISNENDWVNSSLIDGRFIYQYYLFIHDLWLNSLTSEEELFFRSLKDYKYDHKYNSSLMPKNIHTKYGINNMDIFEYRFQYIPEQPDIFINSKFESLLLICHAKNQNYSINVFSDSLKILSDICMVFFVDIAFAVFLHGVPNSISNIKDAYYLETPNFGDKNELSVYILMKSLAVCLSRFICIELKSKNISLTDSLNTNISFLNDLFLLSVLYEYRRRKENIFEFPTKFIPYSEVTYYHKKMQNLFFKPNEIFNKLKSIKELPLTCEIISCWYPGWRRSLFIYDSPFDYITSLED